MTTVQVYVTLAVFSAVILAIAFELVDMVLLAPDQLPKVRAALALMLTWFASSRAPCRRVVPP